MRIVNGLRKRGRRRPFHAERNCGVFVQEGIFAGRKLKSEMKLGQYAQLERERVLIYRVGTRKRKRERWKDGRRKDENLNMWKIKRG